MQSLMSMFGTRGEARGYGLLETQYPKLGAVIQLDILHPHN